MAELADPAPLCESPNENPANAAVFCVSSQWQPSQRQQERGAWDTPPAYSEKPQQAGKQQSAGRQQYVEKSQYSRLENDRCDSGFAVLETSSILPPTMELSANASPIVEPSLISPPKAEVFALFSSDLELPIKMCRMVRSRGGGDPIPLDEDEETTAPEPRADAILAIPTAGPLITPQSGPFSLIGSTSLVGGGGNPLQPPLWDGSWTGSGIDFTTRMTHFAAQQGVLGQMRAFFSQFGELQNTVGSLGDQMQHVIRFLFELCQFIDGKGGMTEFLFQQLQLIYQDLGKMHQTENQVGQGLQFLFNRITALEGGGAPAGAANHRIEDSV